jgi:Eco57I restriction-modification methylase
MFSLHDTQLPNPIFLPTDPYQIIKTPESLVRQMLDIFPEDAWRNPDWRYLNPVSKTGVFELWMYAKLMKGLEWVMPDKEERRDYIVGEMIYSFCPNYATYLLTRRHFLGMVYGKDKYKDVRNNVHQIDFLDKDSVEIGTTGEIFMKKAEKNVKFSVVVGNPPYQQSDGAGGGGASAKALYPIFVEKAMELNPDYMSMVIPAPWMSGNGKGTASFLERMLACKKLASIRSTEKSEEWFPGVLLPGGIMYFLMKGDKDDTIVNINGEDTDLDGQEVILVDPMGISIRDKVLSKCEEVFENKMFSRNPYGIISAWNDWSDDPDSSYVCHTKGGAGGGEITKLLSKEHVKKNEETIDKWKLCIPKAYGAERGSTGNPFIVKPGAIITETYLMIGCFDTEDEVLNAELFIRTYLAQYLVSLLKVKNTSSKTFKFVPYLDFTRPYTNQDLYDMFDLTKKEIEHVENTTKNYIVFRTSKRVGKKN